jgi:hypothetical protein
MRELKVLLGVAEPFDDGFGRERFRADPAGRRRYATRRSREVSDPP